MVGIFIFNSNDLPTVVMIIVTGRPIFKMLIRIVCCNLQPIPVRIL